MVRIMSEQTFHVTGMTCEHCVRAVTQEVTAIDGVDGVVVDLSTGAVTVTSNGLLDADAVAEAVDQAGYELVRS